MNIREYSPCQCECGSGSFLMFRIVMHTPLVLDCNIEIFSLSLLIWLLFFLRRTWGVRFWCSFSSFSAGAFFLRFGWSSDESFRFWHHDSKALVLNSSRFITIWKQRSCQFFISSSLSRSLSLSFSLFLARSLSLTWLLFFSCGVHCKFETLMFLIMVSEWNLFFYNVVAPVIKIFDFEPW